MAHFLLTYSNALYKQVNYGWDQTSAYTGAVGSRYQSISNLTQHINEWNEAWPQHQELYALLFCDKCVVLLRPTGLCEHRRVVRRGLRYLVHIREDLKV